MRKQNKRALLLATGIALLLASGCAKKPAPNVIVLMVDTLRADYLGFHGFDGPISPALDALTTEAVVYENCFAQSPWTKPSTASLFTSLYAQVHQLTDHEGEFWNTDSNVAELRTGVLPDRAVTLAEALREAGYRTGGFVSNPWVKAEYGFAQGFDHFDESGTVTWVRADTLIDQAQSWIESLPPGEPFLAYLHFMDVHAPYDAPRSDYEAIAGARSLGGDQLIEEASAPYEMYQNIERRPEWATDEMRHRLHYWRARYASGVRAFDRRLGVFLQFLRDSGLLDTSVIVVTSDHGEELFEHGGWSHGQNLYDEQLHVPLVIRMPEARDGGTRVSPVVELVDIMPTLLAIAGVDPSPGVQGRDISRPSRLRDEEITFATATQKAPGYYSLRTPRYKLHHNIDNGGSWLFDLIADPAENENLADGKPELVDELKRRLGAHLEQSLSGGTLGSETTGMSPEMLERLKSLGYLN